MNCSNRNPMRYCRDSLATVILVLSCTAIPVRAMPPPNITANETALLPTYCIDTQTWPGGKPGGIERGKAIYGDVFWHFHHYCYSMVWLMRAERSTLPAMERRGNLAGALDDLEYVLKYMPPDHFLLPEMLTRKGKILRMQNKIPEAIEVLREAITLSKTYWRAFSELALCYQFANELQQAIFVLREGLTHNPQAKVLTLYLQDLESQATAKTHSKSPTSPKQQMRNRTNDANTLRRQQ